MKGTILYNRITKLRHDPAIVLIFFLCLMVPNLNGQLVFESSNLPIVKINTLGREIQDEPKITALMQIIYDENKERNHLADTLSFHYEGKINIEIRGNSSQRFPKKQYLFETQKEDGSNDNVSLVGMPKENDWILYAPYSDKSLIRNVLTYELAKPLGHYVPRVRFCELILNEEYQGIYVLTEKIKRDKNRVNIKKVESNVEDGDDLSGGYLFKVDRSNDPACLIGRSNQANIKFLHEYPDCDEATEAQKDYLINLINDFEEILFCNNFPEQNDKIEEYIDLQSAIDYILMSELTNNVDAYIYSTYFHKNKNSIDDRIHFGPLWDYNLAWGNASYRHAYRADGLKAMTHPWMRALLQNASFSDSLRQRWKSLRQDHLSIDRIFHCVDSLVEVSGEAGIRNFEKWPVIGEKVWPNYFVGESYEDEINYLKSWIINRLDWLDQHLDTEGFQQGDPEDFKATISPNPNDGDFTYSFYLDEAANVSILIFDMLGRKISELLDYEFLQKGEQLFHHSVKLSKGYYFIILEVNDKSVSRKKINIVY